MGSSRRGEVSDIFGQFSARFGIVSRETRTRFVFAYERSAARYKAVRESLGAPDPFRLQYRAQLKETVAEIIRSAMTPTAVAPWVRDNARAIPEPARARFLSIVESELAALHEGNYARYRVTPSEFARWDANWTAARGPRTE